jgi:hypothetical protein
MKRREAEKVETLGALDNLDLLKKIRRLQRNKTVLKDIFTSVNFIFQNIFKTSIKIAFSSGDFDLFPKTKISPQG